VTQQCVECFAGAKVLPEQHTAVVMYSVVFVSYAILHEVFQPRTCILVIDVVLSGVDGVLL